MSEPKAPTWDDVMSGKYFKFSPNVATLLGFKSWRLENISFSDKGTGKEDIKPGLHLEIDQIGDYTEDKILRTTSKRLCRALRPFCENGEISKKLFEITQSGSGYQTQYTVKALKNKPSQAKAKIEDAGTVS